MDLVPKPGQVVTAAGNVAHMMLYGGLADLRPLPRTLIDEGELRELYHYRPRPHEAEQGDPVLLVTPLAAPAVCYDLRRGCSLVEHLVEAGRPTYLVEYGHVSFRDRALGLEHWVEEVLPASIEAVSRHAGGRPVHVVGWSLGGIFALLAAADRPDLPIASLTALGTPFDVRKVPIVAPMRPLLNLTDGGGPVNRLYQAMGGAPQPLVRWAFQLTSVQKLVTKPLVKAVNLDDADYLAQLEAVDRFIAGMTAYPGRTFGQLYHRFIRANGFARGTMELGERTIRLADITAPVLLFAGLTDGIAPIASVRPGVPLMSGAQEVRFEMVPGGHLGMLTGRQARGSTWRVLDEWLDQWSGRAVEKVTRKRTSSRTSAAKKGTPARKAAVEKGAVKKGAVKKGAVKKGAVKKSAAGKTAPARKSATAKKAAAKKTTAAKPGGTKKAAPTKKPSNGKAATRKPAKSAEAGSAKGGTPEIGVNPRRRHGSAGSRALAR